MSERGPGAGAELAVATGSVLMRLVGRFYDLETSGAEHIPRHEPVVLGINHFSHLDPVVVTYLAGRNVRYLAVDELFGQSEGFNRLIGFFGAIPMSRERPPLGALRTAIDDLARGGAVGVFPEGRRVAYWGESAPKEGAAWLSLRTGAPLVAVSIVGTESSLSVTKRSLHRAAVRVWADPPLDPDEFRNQPNPRRAMTVAWAEIVASRVGHWVPEPTG